ncbi:MAG: tetraacyldisaccharide 4'-kinase [Dokdonella sp.]
MNFAERLQAIWYRTEPPPLALRALVPLYAGLRNLYRLPYRLGLRTSQRLPLPVIVVGNLTVGGSGKTPLVLALIDALRERGWNPGVISRGYGGKATIPMRVDDDSDPALVGDEPCLIRQRSGAPLAVARRRTDAGRLLLLDESEIPPNVLIADDGLQHIALARDIEICVIDGVRRFGNGYLLPAGPLREPLVRLAHIPFHVVNGDMSNDGEISMQLSIDGVVSLLDASHRESLASWSGRRVHAVAGIGNPDRFFHQLRDAGIVVIEHPLPDHHPFVIEDVSFNDDLPVLMTEKDAIKCRAFADKQMHYVEISAMLPTTFFEDIDARLKRCSQRFQRSNVRHSRQ